MLFSVRLSVWPETSVCGSSLRMVVVTAYISWLWWWVLGYMNWNEATEDTTREIMTLKQEEERRSQDCVAASFRNRIKLCIYVRLSATPLSLCSRHCIIMNFSGVITNDQHEVHTKGQGQRSKVKVTEIKTQLNRCRTITPVGIHIWWWNDAQSLMLLRRGALLFFKVIWHISRSHG